jgi:outer membrane protein
MRKFLTYAVVALGMGALATPVAAQSGIKIGFINSQRLIAEAPGAREAQQTFERDMARFKGELEKLEGELKTMLTDYEQQQVMMSPDAKRQREEAIRQRQRAFQQRAGELEETAARRQDELVEPIMTRINSVIEEFRKEGGYGLILDTAAGGIVAADPALDLTEQVLTRLRATASARP